MPAKRKLRGMSRLKRLSQLTGIPIMKRSMVRVKRARSSATSNGRAVAVGAIPRSLVTGRQEYRISRKINYAPFAISLTTGNAFGATSYAFKLSDLQTATDFTGLFATFRVNSIQVDFIPQWSDAMFTFATGGVAVVSNILPLLYSVVNENDAAVTTEAAFLENSKTQIINLSEQSKRVISVKYKPFCLQGGITAGSGTPTTPVYGMELNCLSGRDTYFYGNTLAYKTAAQNVATGPGMYWYVIMTMDISFYKAL